MDAVRALAEEIGPRPSCSAAEARAAEWCAARLDEFGYEVVVDEFPSRSAYAPWFIAYLSIAVLAAFLTPLAPLVAFVLGVSALVLYGRDSEGRPILRPRGAVSRNVVARRPGGVEASVVVVAHMDSARSSPSFHPRMVGNLRASTIMLNVVLALVPFAAAAAWFFDGEDRPVERVWIAALLLALYLLVAIALLAWGRRMPLVPGANDNATGVEVLMRLAGNQAGNDVWFVVTGSEESGMVGIQAFLERHAPAVVGSTFVNIDSVGAGEVIAASAEGLLRERRPPGPLLDLAEQAGASPKPFRGMPTDATPLLARGLRAISLLAIDERGVIPNWHWPTDVPENVDGSVVDETARVADAFLRRVLAEAEARPG